MARNIVVLSGPVAAGKSSLAAGLKVEYSARVVRTRLLLQERFAALHQAGDLNERRALQEFGEHLDGQDGGAWLAEDVTTVAQGDEPLVVIDSVRVLGQIEALRERFGRRVWHVHLFSSDVGELADRYDRRRTESELHELGSYRAVQENRTESEVPSLAQHADLVLDTHRNTQADILVRCAARLGLLADLDAALVDILVGGEYGSEGKGNLAFYLAPEYDLLMRVGGPNAGHQVPTPETNTHRSIPSGASANQRARLLIGPGAVISPRVLFEEFAETGVDPRRLIIDPQAMVITPEDVAAEKRLKAAIGSTGQGVGQAAARRILGRDGDRSILAEGCEDLKPFLGSARQVLAETFAAGQRVLLEGTQGTGLSLFHGQYPHVTSRDTTAAGVLSEAGISSRRVRRTIVAFRTYPIRVGGPSGPMGGKELTWEDIASRSGLPRDVIVERGSVSNNQRRVAEFDWTLLRWAADVNGATDIAITFVDYLDKENQNAYRFDQLTSETIQFLEEVERVAGAPVSLISTKFSTRAVIDRRDWRGHVLT
ncbi:adenylosuccinate synthetase [Pedococcus bigeumensis]|uniref:Adenylosuccinate synthetase n=1 Tax=Pedococcus bigeumensis TaxID=433644 RepID=A0A502CZH7_9MICO|nr:adenylosuccinate synthetase [Pedococcus bigeumensis]TPG17161.1 adenylosuccinate synthase [Pedococcus bigeumensis]